MTTFSAGERHKCKCEVTMGRTMVKVRAIGHDTLTFQTISLKNGVSPQFLLPISEFEEMDRRGQLSVKSTMDAEHPIPHRAVFIRITSSRQLLICFRWLNSLDASGSARTECVQLPYDDLEAFLERANGAACLQSGNAYRWKIIPPRAWYSWTKEISGGVWKTKSSDENWFAICWEDSFLTRRFRKSIFVTGQYRTALRIRKSVTPLCGQWVRLRSFARTT